LTTDQLRKRETDYLKRRFSNGAGRLEGSTYVEQKCIQTTLDTSVTTDYRRINSWDQQIYFTCPKDYSITNIQSHHHNHHEDREWGAQCSQLAHGYDKCYWLGYVNSMDNYMNFHCNRHGAVITGMFSYHNNHHEDRMWKYQCCYAEKTCWTDCKLTSYINYWDSPMNYGVSGDRRIVGFVSHHDNHREDRMWRAYECTIRAC